MKTATSLFSKSAELIFLGTDSAEVIKSAAAVEKQFSDDWQVFESIKLGAPRNLSIQVSNRSPSRNGRDERTLGVVRPATQVSFVNPPLKIA